MRDVFVPWDQKLPTGNPDITLKKLQARFWCGFTR